jgi:hypothetical protein
MHRCAISEIYFRICMLTDAIRGNEIFSKMHVQLKFLQSASPKSV